MNNLMSIMDNGEIEVTSRNIAEWTEKLHKHIMADIRKELEALKSLDGSIFRLVEYKDAKGETRPQYIMSEDGVMQLALKYDAQTRYKCIQRLKELKNKNNKLPMTYKQALLALVESEEEKERLQLENAQKEQIITEMKPKASYYDLILQNKGAVAITKIAKDYGMTGVEMNALLHNLKVQYKMGNMWLLYQNHAEQGYTQSKTHTTKNGYNIMHTYWLQKGRLFIYDLLKNKCNIVPLIERDELEIDNEEEYDDFDDGRDSDWLNEML
jgi:phage antirepressor YoqD-like protein